MTDEKYTFISDVRDKKRTARGAFNRRTHAGKGGAVKTPYDYMSKKEREAMNGEVKSYKLNDPMTWAEFKQMPDDLQSAYIQALQNKYGVSTVKLGEMFGATQRTVSAKMIKLGINTGRHSKRPKFDAEGWAKFIHGIKNAAEAEPIEGEPVERMPETPLEKPEPILGGGKYFQRFRPLQRST